MVKLKGFEFSLIEFAGALGDFGPLNPFIIAYIAILSLNPTGVLLTMGLTNIIIELIYKLPLPVEPQKAVATVALNERWGSSIIFGTGIGLGVIWLILVAARLVRKIAKITPISVIVGIQLGLMLILLRESAELIVADVLLALVAFILVLLLIKNRKLPAGIAIFLLGLAIVFFSNPNLNLKFGFYLPQFFTPSFQDMYVGLFTVGVAQLALTISNAILATCLLVNEKFPSRKMKEENLATNMGWMNAVFPFFGGVPMCHGAGGFASQYFFGARTGGAMLMEGIVEIFLAFFLAESIVTVFSRFPQSIIGVMLFFASLELGRLFLTIKKKMPEIILQ
ncbi:MAG: putative sulfate/molybdate transporter [bacterium]